ncbi:MAG: hypothetical protein COT31_03685 [Candidatus Moranbacteria bacterium CG08_land_8_20_14_0_20_34_16]|nr:MAG: hypothetical protein COT31_03685 [Candidatus Moranbacteria bacterium CG08_land_8_20_14_0_20_34_16]
MKFNKGTIEQKKEILSALCSNPIIKDQKLTIQAEEWFQVMRNGYKPLETEYLRLELNKTPLSKAKSEALTSLIATWHKFTTKFEPFSKKTFEESFRFGLRSAFRPEILKKFQSQNRKIFSTFF